MEVEVIKDEKAILLPNLQEVKEILKVIKFDKLRKFTAPQLALFEGQKRVDLHKVFPYRNTIIICLSLVAALGFLVVLRCVLQLRSYWLIGNLKNLRDTRNSRRRRQDLERGDQEVRSPVKRRGKLFKNPRALFSNH